jgi:hypothetical protein
MINVVVQASWGYPASDMDIGETYMYDHASTVTKPTRPASSTVGYPATMTVDGG